MNLLIADIFTDSLARLTGDPGLSFYKLDKAKDKRFCPLISTGNC